jgi:hypothetical protein
MEKITRIVIPRKENITCLAEALEIQVGSKQGVLFSAS